MAMPIGDVGYAKRCPFCGNPELQLITIPGKDGFRTKFAVRCNYDEGGCGGAGGIYNTPEEAVAMWNQRRRKYRG